MSIISLLIYLVVAGLVFWLVQYAIAALPIPRPFNIVIYVVLVIIAIYFLLGLVPGNHGLGHL